VIKTWLAGKNMWAVAGCCLLAGFLGSCFGLVYAFPRGLDRIWFVVWFALAVLAAVRGLIDWWKLTEATETVGFDAASPNLEGNRANTGNSVSE
jgi:hypothetical protein